MDLQLRRRRTQRGAVAVMVALLIVALIGMLGIVIDLTNLYVRKTELQNAADAAALAGARLMNGSAAGLEDAVNSPRGAIAIAAANSSDLAKLSVAITAAQISFGPTPDGPWSDLPTAKSSPSGMGFIKVDTAGIAQGTRPTWFMSAIDSALASTTANAVAVAGTTICEGLPIFICPPAGGFTQGQAYFFADEPGAPIGAGNIGYFDPVPPGATSLINGANDMRDIICAGKTYCLGSPSSYSSLTQSGFGAMARAFNSRFGKYAGLPSHLTAEVCPPDTNVKEYIATADVPWMTTTAGDPLSVYWSASRPPTLPGTPAVNGSYPASGTPYAQTTGDTFEQPNVPYRPYAQSGRRILTLAIGAPGACDGSVNGSGKPVPVQGFGRFLLPRTAEGTGSPKGIYVEYIETVSSTQSVTPEIKLYR